LKISRLKSKINVHLSATFVIFIHN
jgi:hypothetical protein